MAKADSNYEKTGKKSRLAIPLKRIQKIHMTPRSMIRISGRKRNQNENIVTHWSVAQTGSNDENTGGWKSRWPVPLELYFWLLRLLRLFLLTSCHLFSGHFRTDAMSYTNRKEVELIKETVSRTKHCMVSEDIHCAEFDSALTNNRAESDSGLHVIQNRVRLRAA